VKSQNKPRTGAERYRDRLADSTYGASSTRARERIDRVDSVMRAIEERRRELDLSKAELGRRAGLTPEAVRRLLSTDTPNPTLSTLISIADALDLSFALIRVGKGGAQNTVRRRADSTAKRRARA
jgi:DNA-binding phage protein